MARTTMSPMLLGPTWSRSMRRRQRQATPIAAILLLIGIVFTTSNSQALQQQQQQQQQQQAVSNEIATPHDASVSSQTLSETNYVKQNYQNNNNNNGAQSVPATQSKIIKKCTKQSIMLARQMLVHELNQMNQFMPIWFNDLDKDELVEAQRHSLSNIVMSGAGTKLLHPNGRPLIEIESSYFRSTKLAPGSANGAHNSHNYATTTSSNNNSNSNNNNNSSQQARYSSSLLAQQQQQQLSIKLIRRHHDRCYLNSDKSLFTYVIGLSIGPIEHHLDVLYNLPKELSLGQPIDWRYAQVTLTVPKMIYEVTLKQVSGYKLNSLAPFPSNCPLDIVDVLYLPPNLYTTSVPQSAAAGQQQMLVPAAKAEQQQQQQQQQGISSILGLVNTNKPQMSITSSGLALNNQTLLQIERLFDDYTRPIITGRLHQMLTFYLNTKTLPLACTV